MTHPRPKYGNKHISFTLPMPPSVNQCYATDWKTKRRFKTKKYDTWIKEAGWACIKMGRSVRFDTPVHVTYTVPFPRDKRRRDIMNLEKPLSDFLVSRGILKDDSLIHFFQIYYETPFPGEDHNQVSISIGAIEDLEAAGIV